MNTKQSRLEIKVDQQGVFTGLLSPYGPPADSGGDIVLAGAFSKNIQQKGNVRPLLFAHETSQPVGTVTLDDRADGLWVKVQRTREFRPEGVVIPGGDRCAQGRALFLVGSPSLDSLLQFARCFFLSVA